MATQPPKPTIQTLITVIIGFVLLITLCAAVLSFLQQPATPDGTLANITPSQFQGIRNPTPNEIHAAIAGSKGKPLLIEFKSKFCLDCKRMSPIIENLKGSYTRIQFNEFDIQELSSHYPLVYKVFHPTTVPAFVFVQPDGRIKNVLHGYQPAEAIEENLQQLEQPNV